VLAALARGVEKKLVFVVQYPHSYLKKLLFFGHAKPLHVAPVPQL